MRNYPIEKYRFIICQEKRQVIAITHDAGKIIRGVATCAPEDKFDIELGKKVAAAKANIKVAKRRVKRAERLYQQACENAKIANKKLEHYKEFYVDANLLTAKALLELDDIFST